MKRIFAVFTLLMLIRAATAQVDIRVSILPPYPSKVTDYASRPQQVLIVLRSMNNLPQDIQLRGTITGDNGIVLRVDPHYKSPTPIHINGGETRNLSAADISQLFDYNTLVFSGISKEQVIRGNGLPEGNYQVCVQAFNYTTNQPLSSGQPLGCSNSFPITSVEPPVILSPFDGQPVSALTTQNFVISWTTPAGAPPSTQYTVNMVEILDGRNPNDAMRSATSPLFFQQTVNAANLLLYGPAMPTLTPGRRYALLVTARDPFNSVTFRNNGRSEVTSFVYGDTTGTGNGAGQTTASSPTSGNLPAQTIKGRLTWYYRKSEETALTTASKFTPPSGLFPGVGLKGTDLALVNATLADPTFVAGAKPTMRILLKGGTGMTAANGNPPNGASGNNGNPGPGNNRNAQPTEGISLVALKNAKPTAPTAPSTSQQIREKVPYAIGVFGGGAGSVSANDPSFFNSYGAESHPMANTILRLLATDTTHPGTTPQLAGTGLTDDQGNFQLSFIPPAAFGSGKGYKYSLSVQDNYFTLPALSFVLPPNSTSYDLGEIKAFANTFRLLAFADDPDKAEVPTAVIGVYRRADFYTSNPSLKSEGNIDPGSRITETIDGQQYIRVSSINDAYTGTRLFYSTGNADEYKIKVGAQDFSDYRTSLSVVQVNTHPTAPQTIQETWQLSAAPTTFYGTVSETTGGIAKQAIPGAIVTLYLTDDAYSKATTKTLNHVISFPSMANSSMVPVGGSSGGKSSPSGKGPNIPSTQTSTGNKSQPPGGGSPQPGNPKAMPINTPAGLINNMAQTISFGQMVTTTDSSGAFTLSNIPVNPNPMHYIISVPGSSLEHEGTVTLTKKGNIAHLDYVFDFIAYAVTGRIVDEANKPVSNAVLNWASGGSRFPANSDGYFATTDKAGTDTLIIHALGFQDRHLPVTITRDLLSKDPPVATAGSGDDKKLMKIVILPSSEGKGVGSATSGSAGASGGSGSSSPRTARFVSSIQSTDTYKQSVAQGNPMNPASFGYTDSKNTMASALWANTVLNPKDNPSGPVDLQNIVLKKDMGRMLITVLDAKKQKIAGAGITIDGTDSTELTGSDGTRYIQGPAGTLQLIIAGPAGSDYAPQEITLTVNETDTAKKTVYLAQGVRVSGQVTAAGKAAPKASVAVDGLDYLQTVTDNSGNYSLVVAKDSSYTFKASMSGFVAQPKTQSFAADGTLNFSLGTASFNISKLLGFTVQIDKITDETATRKKLSGSFINLPGNAVFSVRPDATIPFTDVEVDITNNLPVPVNGVVTTDLTNLPMKAFNFLPVTLTNGTDALVIRQTGTTGDAGQLEGSAAIDYASFMPSGIAPYVDASLKEYLQNGASASGQTTVVLNSSGTLTASSLSVAGSGTQSFNLYGFTVTLDLAHSSVKSDGLHLAGSISMNTIPLLSNTTFQIQDLWVGTNGYISGVKVNMSPAPTFSIAGWSATLNALSFSDNGFSVGGNIKVQIPGSQVSEVDFANLSIANDQLYGGSFTIPSGGIDVFGVVKFLGGPVPLSFGKLGNSSVYYIGGSGSVHFPSLFGDMSLQFFQIQTNGQFAATVPTNINEDFFGLASVTITDISFHTNNGMGVDVQGNFLLKAIPWIKANVGGVHFGTGGSVSVDDIGLSFDMVGIAKVSANLQFVNQADKKGFAGTGSITIAGLPGANISFSYFKVPNGISVSAFFQANVVIPIGAIVSINNPGGGFSLNTGDGSWSVTITGDASITGLGTAVSVANINVTVSNGPVIKGSANLDVLTVNIANADLLVDIPKSLLKIDINAGINLIPKVVTAQGSATFVLSAAKNDTYFLIGAQYQSSLLGIFNENANITAGWGLNVANHPELANYTSFIEPGYLDNGVLKGIDLQAQSDIGVNLTGTLFSVVTGNIYYTNNALVKLNMGIGAGTYGIYIGAGWSAGGSVSIDGHDIAAVNVAASGDVSGYYDNGSGNISLAADLAGHFDAHVGDCDDDCYTGLCGHICHDFWGVQLCAIPTGVKICLDGKLHLSYDNQNGFGISFSL
ncbi:MAG TPA: hypothetical protein VK563_22930 [Puia sp.]|nr:hypothetical protein [Puia sp.]